MGIRSLDYKQIGLKGLTANRRDREVPVGPKGTLSDYVPFHFCPRSVMLLQIHTGKVETYLDGQEPILHLVTTVDRVESLGLPYVFTDRHAKTSVAEFYTDKTDLNMLDWEVIGSSSFARMENDPDRPERKEAEFLVHKWMPLEAIIGIGVYNKKWKEDCEALLQELGFPIKVQAKSSWYF